nr:hypothetical protein [uncultured Campylobacter sp.]
MPRLLNLSPLAALAKLKELNIEVSGVQDLAPIGKLSELECLRADDNRIADVWVQICPFAKFMPVLLFA